MSIPRSLTIENLVCSRGDRTLFVDLNAQLSEKQCLHVIGSNGSGKTSLLRILTGLAPAESGQVLWNQSKINNNSDYLSSHAFIAHKDALKNELTAIENLRFYQRLNLSDQTNSDQANNAAKSKSELESQLDDCLDQLEILHCADLLAQQLSFGQRRRLAFARLLLKPYKIWILDEPFTGIDARGRELIEALLKNHLENDGMIILTHHQSLQQSCLQDYLSELHLESTSGLMPSDKSLGR